MKKIIINVLEEWVERQPNMASESCRELLAEDLDQALRPHLQIMIEEIITGVLSENE